MAKKKLLICFGTRPEAIKLAPLVKELSGRAAFDVKVCVTSQHRQMLDQVLNLFEIDPDYDLNVMTERQTLGSLTGAVLDHMTEPLIKEKPDGIVVQGDTTTTFAASLAAYYHRVSVVHVEAGLRTYQKFAPFPEEMNRKMTGCLTDWHFPPTERAYHALLKEGYPADRIFIVGNTVIDSLLTVGDKAQAQQAALRESLPMIDFDKRILLVTGHRRENFGQGFLNICKAIAKVAHANPDLEIVYPVHLNPNVQEPVNNLLSDIANIHLIPPQDYLTFVWLLQRSYLVLTDSGGVQEEAPSMGKPVLVMRETTERPEAVEAGVARLVGRSSDRIIQEVQHLLDDEQVYGEMSSGQNPYGDGTSSRQIADILEKSFNEDAEQEEAL